MSVMEIYPNAFNRMKAPEFQNFREEHRPATGIILKTVSVGDQKRGTGEFQIFCKVLKLVQRSHHIEHHGMRDQPLRASQC